MKFVKEHMKQCLLPLAFVVAAATAEETVPSLLDGNMTVIEEPIFSVTFDGKLVAVDLKEKTECTLPPFVKSVARTAFAGCSNLVSVTIPSTVTNIECALMEPVEDYPGVIVGYDKLRVTYSPFDDCLKLRNVSVSQYVCDIGLPIVFGNAREVITNVIFDSSVTNIRNSTIDAWYRIRRVETGDLVGMVGCSNIESVTFSTDVTMVRERVTMEPKKYELAYQPPPLGEKHGIFGTTANCRKPRSCDRGFLQS